MIRIRIKDTGETKEVTKNEAFDLIDRGLAELFFKPVTKVVEEKPVAPKEPEKEAEPSVVVTTTPNTYTNRQIKSSS